MLPDRWPGFVPWGISALLVLAVVTVLATTGAFAGSSVSDDHQVRLVNDFNESRDVQLVIRAENGTNAAVTIQMDQCHGDVLLSIEEDGDLSGTYSIC
jgi:outer membrane lipoprotein SlyB